MFFLIGNIAIFSIVNNYSKRFSKNNLVDSKNNIEVIEKGWEIINWSYSLLKYFKKPNTTSFK